MTDQFLDRHAENLIKRLRSKHHDNISCKGRNPADYSTLEGEAADLIAALKAEIERLKSPWQPIATAPKDRPIQLWRKAPFSDGFPVSCLWVDTQWERGWSDLNRRLIWQPDSFSHWCEIQAPPVEGEETGK